MGREQDANDHARALRAGMSRAEQGQAPRVRDDRGRVLEIGDEVILMQPGGSYRVASVTPLIDPMAPHAMRITLVARVDVVCERDQNIRGLVRVRHAAEFGDGQKLAEPQATPTPKHPLRDRVEQTE